MTTTPRPLASTIFLLKSTIQLKTEPNNHFRLSLQHILSCGRNLVLSIYPSFSETQISLMLCIDSLGLTAKMMLSLEAILPSRGRCGREARGALGTLSGITVEAARPTEGASLSDPFSGSPLRTSRYTRATLTSEEYLSHALRPLVTVSPSAPSTSKTGGTGGERQDNRNFTKVSTSGETAAAEALAPPQPTCDVDERHMSRDGSALPHHSDQDTSISLARAIDTGCASQLNHPDERDIQEHPSERARPRPLRRDTHPATTATCHPKKERRNSCANAPLPPGTFVSRSRRGRVSSAPAVTTLAAMDGTHAQTSRVFASSSGLPNLRPHCDSESHSEERAKTNEEWIAATASRLARRRMRREQLSAPFSPTDTAFMIPIEINCAPVEGNMGFAIPPARSSKSSTPSSSSSAHSVPKSKKSLSAAVDAKITARDPVPSKGFTEQLSSREPESQQAQGAAAGEVVGTAIGGPDRDVQVRRSGSIRAEAAVAEQDSSSGEPGLADDAALA